MNLDDRAAVAVRGVTSFAAQLDTPSGRDWVRRAVWFVVAASVLAFLVRGASRPDDPSFAAAPAGSGRVLIEGFAEVAFTTTGPAGAVGEWCAMLADTPELRARGLMGQRDLGGYDAMLFRFDSPVTTGFWMKDTVIPLTVAYLDGEGRFVSAADMQPCPPGTDCPSYPPEGAYTTAVEVPAGGLGAIGLGPGASIAFGGGGCA